MKPRKKMILNHLSITKDYHRSTILETDFGKKESFSRKMKNFLIIFLEIIMLRLPILAHFLLRITVRKHFVGFLFVFDVLFLAEEKEKADWSVWNILC